MAFAKVGNLKGPKGDAGPRGSGIFTGNGAPTGTAYIVGDLYIDLSTGDLYLFS